jgi:hypothetical protein
MSQALALMHLLAIHGRVAAKAEERGFRPLGRGTARSNDNQSAVQTEGNEMGLILLVLLLALLLGAFGFAVHVLWIIAVVVFIAWLVGFGVARGESAGGRGRWYRW